MKATGHQATSPVDEALSRTQPLNPAGSGIASAQRVQTSSRARPSLLETIRNWMRPAPDLNQVFDQIDPGCHEMMCHKRSLKAGLCELGERIKSHPQISGVHLGYAVDPENGREVIIAEASSNLTLDDASKFEDEVLADVSKSTWWLHENVIIHIGQGCDD